MSDFTNFDMTDLARTFPAPPDHFDPHTAPDHLLQRHGLPPRPDPGRQPQLARWWREVFAPPIRFVEAKVSVDPNLAGRDPFRRRAPGFATGDWAGAERGRVDDSDYSAAATFIAARWMVPVTYPFDPDGYTSIVDGFWVGIDGAEQRQILQAGIAADVQPGYFSSDIDYYAWGEWYPNLPCRFDNFPVAPGDLIACLVMALAPDLGLVSMANITRNHGSSMMLPAPGGIRSQGQTAEWVVEQVSDMLPVFTPVVFEGCVAGSATEAFGPVPGPGSDITDSNGTPITRSWVLTSDSVLVRWAGFGDNPPQPPPDF
jgi:hypothetical protein